MRRMMLSVGVACAVALTAGSVAAQSGTRNGGSSQDRQADQRTVTGCLSVNAAARTYVLTTKPDDLAKTGGALTEEPTTITYQLVGGDGLQNMVGHTIEVKGRVDPKSTATAESESEAEGKPRATSGTDKQPKVETKAETKIRAQVLRVESFRSISSTCKPTRQ